MFEILDKIKTKKTIVNILFLFLCIFSLPLMSLAQDYNEAYSAIENLASEIRMNSGAVAQVLSEAINAKHGELEKWKKLEEQMNQLGSSVNKNLPEIGKNLNIVRQTNIHYTPYVEIYDIFGGHLSQARNKKKELLDLAKTENEKLNTINKMIAKLDKDLLNASKEYLGAALEGFLPDEISLAGEGSIIVLGAYFGPPGIVVAGAAWGAVGTFNSLINLYYNTKSLADQTKIMAEAKQGLQKRKAELEKNLNTLMEGAKEMEQVENILERQEKRLNEFKEKIINAKATWNGQIEDIMANRKKKIDEEIKERLSKEKYYKSSYRLCNGTEITLDAGEYKGEIESIINTMDSYSKAVEDGGDPDNLSSFIADWHNKLHEDYQKRSENYNKATEALNKASKPCYDGAGKFDEGWWSRYCSCIGPYEAARANAWKEISKISSIHNKVSGMFYLFDNRVRNATEAKTKEFWDLYRLWEGKFGYINRKIYNVESNIPYWTIEDYSSYKVEKIDQYVQHQLQQNYSVIGIKTDLLLAAERIEELDKTIKEAIKLYEEINTQRHLTANQAKSELTSFLNKWSKLIGYYWGIAYIPTLSQKAEFIPHAPEVEKGIKIYMERIKNDFDVKEPDIIVKAKRLNLSAIAAKYKSKADELTFYTDWIDTYRHRLEGAAGTLSRISWEKTKKGFYGTAERDRLEKELSSPPWSEISKEVDKIIPKDELNKYFGSGSEAGINNPWRKIYLAQQTLLAKLNKEASYYVKIRSNKGFQPVAPGIINPLIENWKRLREICERYDALIKPLREEIIKAPEEIQKTAQPVFETYNKMPAFSRNAVISEHYRFSDAYSNLLNYLNGKLDVLKPTLDSSFNNIASQLDDLLLKYPELYAKWQKEQEEELKRAEEIRRRYEEEQKRLEAEKKKREEEEKRQAEMSINIVREMYAKFKSAYETKNDALVVSFLSRNWQASDGTSLSEIQKNLKNSFRVFDEVKWDMNNLSIQHRGENVYHATYDLTITGRIFKRNIKHEEKSRVTERVIVEKNGKAYIESTIEGRFWTAN